MANLVDTSVNGDLRVTGKIYGTVNAVNVNDANLAVPAVGSGDYVGSTGDYFVGSGSGRNLPDTTNNFNIHATVTHYTSTTYRVTQIATPTSSTQPTGIYERCGTSTNGTSWTFGSWMGTSSSSHSHGNIANGGTLTDTAAAAAGNDYVVIRDADNAKIQTSTIKGTEVADAVSKRHSHSTLTLSTTPQEYDGSHTLALPSSDPYTSARTPTSHASSATTYGVGTTANYGHVKLDNSTPLTVGTTSTDGVATGKAHIHNALESVARASVTTADLDHVHTTNERAHMILSQITSATSTTHDPGDGYMLSFMWDNTGKYDAQVFIPDGGTSTTNFGRLKVRYCNNSAWGDWGYLPLAADCATLTNSDDLDNIKGSAAGQVLGYKWSTGAVPANAPVSTATSSMLVYQTHSAYCYQVVFTARDGVYRRLCNNGTWEAWSKELVAADIATGTANGTISVAGSDVAVKGLGGAAYLNTGTASGTVATGNHTHTTSIASDSSSGTVVTLAHDTQYKLTAGGTSVLFKTPADSNTDTKVKATAKTDNVNYKVLATASASPTSGNATEAIYDTDISLNPSTNTITANISGTAAKPTVTVLSSQSSSLSTYKGSTDGDVLWYRWAASSIPDDAPLADTSALMCVQRITTNEIRQTVYCGSGQIFTRKYVDGMWDYHWLDLGGVSPENYSTGVIFGASSKNKYYKLATVRSAWSQDVTTTSIFLIDRLTSNDFKQDLGYLVISSTCTDETTPKFSFSASLVMISDNVTKAQIKVFGDKSTGLVDIYAYGTASLTANDTGHVGARGILVTVLDVNASIGSFVTFSPTGAITGDAPTGLTAVSIINSTHTHSTDDLTSGVLPVTRGGTGTSSSGYVNAIIAGNSSNKSSAFQGIRTKNGALYATAQDGTAQFGTLPVAQGGTGLTTTTSTNAVIIGNSSDATGSLQAVSTASGAFYSKGANAKPLFGTLPVAQGGTGLTTTTSKNAVIIGNSSSVTGAMQTVAAANGAFYSTGANVKPQFGTLPVAQGGTGTTTAADACNAFINALDTDSSTPVDADYYVSQYVNGGTTTTTYHRRPMSALWTYINGKLTSVSGVDISGNAATATNSTNSAVTADTTHQLYLIGATGSSGQQALKTDTGIYATATAGQLHATTFDINSKCTLQFNTTTNALDFVFA